MIKLYVDASFQPRTALSGIGILYVENKEQKQFFEIGPSNTDNHYVEFYATIRALELVEEMGKSNEFIFLYTDSQIVSDTVKKNYVKHSEYQHIATQLLQLLTKFAHVYIEWIPDVENRGADQLARQGLARAQANHLRNEEEK